MTLIKLLRTRVSKLLLMAAAALTTHALADCASNLAPTTPNSRFVIHDDGTVTDSATGLMWQRCSVGQTWYGSSCTGEATESIWQLALSRAASNEFAQYDDWRLPNIKELASIVELTCTSPAINSDVFSASQTGDYWSNTNYVQNHQLAWTVSMLTGRHQTNLKTNNYFLRLVRDN